MKRKFAKVLSVLLSGLVLLSAVSCGKKEKNITVVIREQGSGTREAFDTVVTDGTHFLEEKVDGKKVYRSTQNAVTQTKTGLVLSSVASDKNAIGYISLGSVDDTVNMVRVGGVAASETTVLDGSYAIQRPFVVMTKKGVTMTARAADFMAYLHSDAAEAHAKAVGCIWLSDPSKRANAGAEPIAVTDFTKQASVPAGDKIVIRGSTSMEKVINAAAKGYAEVYGANAEDLFDIELEGSSVGRKAVENDTTGNVIGLSSASVAQDNVNSFNLCLDAVAVIVNKDNIEITDLTLEQLYAIFSGSVTKFSALSK